MVVVEPICPPLSMPSATTASAPARSIIFAIATLATTGMTFTPAFFHNNLRYILRIGIEQHDIHAEGFVSQFFAFTDFLPDNLRRSGSGTDDT